MVSDYVSDLLSPARPSRFSYLATLDRGPAKRINSGIGDDALDSVGSEGSGEACRTENCNGNRSEEAGEREAGSPAVDASGVARVFGGGYLGLPTSGLRENCTGLEGYRPSE